MESTQKNIRIGRFFLSNGFYVVFAALFIFYSLSSQYFLTPMNIRNVFSDSAALMVTCAGLGFVVLTGSLDLSVGSIGFVCAAISGLMIKAGYSPWLSFFLALIGGIILGSVNGALISYLRFNPLLVTLGMMIGLRGVAMHLSRGWQIYLPGEVKQMAVSLLGPVPRLVIFALLVIILGQIVLSRSKFGRYVVALGCNENSARRVGINVNRIRFLVFVVSGACAALGGLVAMLNMGVLQPTLGKGLEFIAVAAIVMGGTSLFGGRGSLLPGTLLGVLMLGIIENGLALLGVSPFAYPLVRGVVIFIAMYADSLKSSRIARI
jgi:ribose/xylose/arabinose/galactoside ABC-type transport system permease subunit